MAETTEDDIEELRQACFALQAQIDNLSGEVSGMRVLMLTAAAVLLLAIALGSWL